ncbi:MAG: NAD(P)/FAD-dependent oxidoreductase [Pseudomonadota bacterium]
MAEKFETDVAIIGAGPVGLFAVFQCGMMGLKCHVIDALPEIGGQCVALYPDKPIYDIPAYPNILAGDLIKNLEAQIAPFKPQYHLDQKVIGLEKQSSKWKLKTSENNEITAEAVIIAAGPGAFGPNKPPLEGIEAFENQSVFYMVKNKDDFKGKNVVIAGGGDSAIDWCLNLEPIAKSVRLVHRRDKFRALPESIEQLKILESHGRIEILTPYQLHSLKGEGEQLTHVGLAHKDGREKQIEADVLLPFYGLSSDLGAIAEWGLNIERNHIQTDPTTAESNVRGIYAIGDIAAYNNKKKFILTGFSEAAFAANHIYQMLNPDAPEHFEYSTTKGVQGF